MRDVAPGIVHEVLHSPGQPLDAATRAFFELRFAHDFSGVHVHTGARASESARAVNALAYTVGSNVVFGAGAYAPQSAPGQRLLAHELAHVVQQSKGLMRSADPGSLTVVPANDYSEREADQLASAVLHSGAKAPAASEFRSKTTAPYGQYWDATLQRQAGQQSAQPAQQTSTQPPPPSPAQQCTNILTATTAEAVRQIQQAENSLTQFAAEQEYPLNASDPRMVEHQRVAAHVTATFNTTDSIDVQAIAFRLARLGRALSGGEVQMSCGTGCGAAGGAILLGRSPGPFQFTLCGINATPAALAPTMIHESAHAVLPDVGVKARPSTAIGAGVLDRAYRQERLFSHLSPMEAMTNAESYSELVKGLLSGSQPGPAPGASDTINQCSSPTLVETALGRAQVAARLVSNWLDGAVDMLQASGSTVVSTITDPFVTDLQTAFPRVTTLAQLRQVANDANVVFTNFISAESVRCRPSGSQCPADRLGFVNNVAITAMALGQLAAILDPSGALNLCPTWSTAGNDDQVAAMYALVATSYLGGAAIQILRPTEALKLARFALLVVGRYLPTPVARSSGEHLLH